MVFTCLIYYAVFLAGALFAKYLITLLIVRLFNLKFPHGAAGANALSSIALAPAVTYAVVKAYENFGYLGYTVGWPIVFLMTLAALAVSPIASLWVFTPEMDALRETDIKEWFVKIAVNLFLSVSLFFFTCVVVIVIMLIGWI